MLQIRLSWRSLKTKRIRITLPKMAVDHLREESFNPLSIGLYEIQHCLKGCVLGNVGQTVYTWFFYKTLRHVLFCTYPVQTPNSGQKLGN